MVITLSQGLLLSIIAFVLAWDKRWESFFAFRPIVVSFVTGMVLGNVQIGLETGAIAELAYLGLLTVGGTVPPDPLMAGLMTTVIAVTSGTSAETALGLSLPFALLMQLIIIIEQSLASVVNSKIDDSLKDRNIDKFKKLVFLPDMFMTLSYAFITFLSVYLAQNAITNFVNAFPDWVTHGFEVAGGLLPAVGLGLLLKVMVTKTNWPYLIFGFVAMILLKPNNVLPIAMIAVGIAFLGYLNDKKKDELLEQTENNQEDNNNVGI